MGRRYVSRKYQRENDRIFISAGEDCFFAVKKNGDVLHAGRELYLDSEYPSEAWRWKEIRMLACSGKRLLGLRKDGTIVVDWSDGTYTELADWENMADVDIGPCCVVGLTEDGCVKKTGKPFEKPELWQNLEGFAVAAHVVGLRKDGTVVAEGDNKFGQCNVEDWRDIVTVAVSDSHTVGLRKDGTVVAVGENEDRERADAEKAPSEVDVRFRERFGRYPHEGEYAYRGGKCDVADWTDIVDIAAAEGYTLGLKSDGTVLVAGKYWKGISEWRDIAAIRISEALSIAVGIRRDGGVLLAGSDVDSFIGYQEWSDLVDVKCGNRGMIGLKSDGTGIGTLRHPSSPDATFLYSDGYHVDDIPGDVERRWKDLPVCVEF